MSKNILQKFRKSLEQSSKIVSDSGLYSHRSSNRRSELETIKQYADRIQNQQSRPSLQQSQNLIKRIPVLVSENDELREKVKRLETQLQQRIQQQDASQRRSYKVVKTEANSEHENRFAKYQSDSSSGSSMIGGRLYESLRIGSRWDGIDRRGRHESSFSSYSLQKRPEVGHLQSEVVKFLQRKVEELRAQNSELQMKYNKVIESKKLSSEEIDRIKQNFQVTLHNQAEVLKKKQDFYTQKIKTLQGNVFKITEECKILQMHNQNLCQKVVDLQLAINKHKFNPKDIILNYKNKCVWEKQNTTLTEEIHDLWVMKELEYTNINHLLQNAKLFISK